MAVSQPTGAFEKRRLLVVGIDGGTWRLLDPMMARGVMPNLAALAGRGFRATLRSTVPPNSAAAWATFITGKNPGRHGILRFQATRPSAELGREFRPGAYTLVNSTSIAGRRLWEMLGELGRRCAVINVPMSYPPRPLNGIMITGLLTPPGAADFTYPRELADALPGYRIEQPLETMGFGEAADRELVRASLEILDVQGRTALDLLAREPWDFFFICFTGTDRLQHRLWNYLDPERRDREPDEANYFKPTLDRYYQQLDDVIGRLVRQAGEPANCIVLSDHGFGPAPRYAVYRRALARELGLIGGEGVGGFHSLRAWLERHNLVTGDRLRRLLAGTPLRRLFSRMARVARGKEQEAWRSSKAYLVVLHKYLGGVGINLAPADPEYEPLRQSLTAKLAGVRDPNTGERIVTHVWRREQLYHGPRLAVCPDIVFRLEENYGLAHGEAPGGRLVCEKDFRSQGIHRDEGILVMAGPDIERADSTAAIHIPDVSASALYLLDAPIPSDLDGRPIAEAIRPDYRRGHPVRSAPAVEDGEGPTVPEAKWRSIEDEEAVADQLRDLGYLD
jgi:predicted AlkP superfamily phosphohydrolase/phosphomutase